MLLRATGHGDKNGPWIPVGLAVHTGTVYIGTVSGAEGSAADIAVLGDTVNIAAGIAAKAGPGEILVSQVACDTAGLDPALGEERDIEIKGKRGPLRVRALH